MSEDSESWTYKTVKEIENSEYIYESQLWNLIESNINKNYPDIKGTIGSEYRYLLLKLHIFRNINARIFYSGRYFFEEDKNYFNFGSFFPAPPYFTDKTVRLNEQKIFKSIEEIAPIPVYLSHNYEEIRNISDDKIRIVNAYIDLTKELRKYRNQKGKEWREDLYKQAKKEYEQNPHTDKTKALKDAFDKFPNKEKYKKEFDLKFQSILRGFYRRHL